MEKRDEAVRQKLIDRLTTMNVDTRNLAVEVREGTVTVSGWVPTLEQQRWAAEALVGIHSLEIGVRPVAPVDSADGRGRSPVTGTSEESAHQSRHQQDPA